LNNHGDNIGNVVQFMEREHKIRFKTILDRIAAKIPGITTWRVHSYKRIGRIPKGLLKKPDPAKRILLDQLPRVLRGYGKKTPYVDAVVVILDTDTRSCSNFLQEQKKQADTCTRKKNLSLSFHKFRDGLRELVKKQKSQKHGDPQDDQIL
jgi:hypothetical protein